MPSLRWTPWWTLGVSVAIGAFAVSVSTSEHGAAKSSAPMARKEVGATSGTSGRLTLTQALSRPFLPESEWRDALDGVSTAELNEALRQLPATFWNDSPLAAPAARHLFGALAKRDAEMAFQRAAQGFSDQAIHPRSRQSCATWAFIGLVENAPQIDATAYYGKFPQELALGLALTRGLILGGKTEDVAGSLGSFETLFFGMYSDQIAQGQKAEDVVKMDMFVAINAWIDRAPLQTAAWLRSESGRRYALPSMAGKALARAAGGDPEELAILAANPTLALSADDVAVALYEGDLRPAEISAFLVKLPKERANSILASYARNLAQGFRIEKKGVLSQFMIEADADLMTKDVANALGDAVLANCSHLFEKLTVNLSKKERDDLLDSSFKASAWSRSLEAARLYFKLRGWGGPQATEALKVAAGKDIQQALAYIADAPKEKRSDLTIDAYGEAVSSMLRDSESAEKILDLAQTAPSETKQKVIEDAMENLSEQYPGKALQYLKAHPETDDALWSIFFASAELPTGDLDSAREALRQARGGTLPAIVQPMAMAAATKRLACEDLESARAVIEKLTDPDTRMEATAKYADFAGEQDPLGTLEYVSRLPSGAVRDAALGRLAPYLTFAPKKLALALALASTDKVREEIRPDPDDAP